MYIHMEDMVLSGECCLKNVRYLSCFVVDTNNRNCRDVATPFIYLPNNV